MKITRVEAIPLALPKIEARCDGTQDALIVRVHTDAGIVGVGEVDASPPVIKAIIEAPMSHTLQHGLAMLLVGEDPLDVERLWEKMYQGSLYYGRRGAAIMAMSGVDIALWDIKGKALGKPIYELLGGAQRKKFRAYASSLFGDTPSETAKLARDFVARGFTAIKFGWGPFGKDPALDEALVRAAREAIGPDVELMVDVGFCWNTETAIQMTERLAPYNIYWLEEPLPPDDLEGYGRLADAVETRIAAGEEETTRFGFRALMDIGKVDVVQPDVTRCGGLTEARRIAQMAAERQRAVVNHSFKTDINIAASLHFLAAIPNSYWFEFSTAVGPLREHTCHGSIQPKDGWIAVPESPGLGVELNPDILQRYAWR